MGEAVGLIEVKGLVAAMEAADAAAKAAEAAARQLTSVYASKLIPRPDAAVEPMLKGE